MTALSVKRNRGGGAPKGWVTEYGLEVAKTGELINYFTLDELQEFLGHNTITRGALVHAARKTRLNEAFVFLSKYRLYKIQYPIHEDEES